MEMFLNVTLLNLRFDEVPVKVQLSVSTLLNAICLDEEHAIFFKLIVLLAELPINVIVLELFTLTVESSVLSILANILGI